MESASSWEVFAYAMLTAVATGLGALPFYFIRKQRDRWLGMGNAMAAGLMIAASFNLINEGNSIGVLRSGLGVVLGLVFIVYSRKWLEKRDLPAIEDLPQASALAAIMIIGVMTLHSFAEGVGVGVAFGNGAEFGGFISLAIAVHNIPEGLAIAVVLVPRGVKVSHAALWAIFSSLPQPLTAMPAFWFVQTFEPFLPIGLGLAAGAMIWMSASELIPEANEKENPRRTAVMLTLAVAAMLAFQALIHP